MGEGSLRLRPCLNELGAGVGELQNHWSASCHHWDANCLNERSQGWSISAARLCNAVVGCLRPLDRHHYQRPPH